MNDQTWTAAITAAGLVLAAIISLVPAYWQFVHKPRKTALDSKAAADNQAHTEQMGALKILVDQIRNSHTKNLRDDLDQKFENLESQIRSGETRTHQRIDQLADRLDRHIDH